MPSSLILESSSPHETRVMGRELASILRIGDVVALEGNLGAGKTLLVQSLAEALGVPADQVQSPTFMLIHEYFGPVPLVHLDVYRLADIDEFLELGADELLGGDNICLIEWADRVRDVLPKDRLTLQLEATGEQARRLTFLAAGPRGEEIVSQLQAVFTRFQK